MGTLQLGMPFEQESGYVVARIVGESERTAAPRLSSNMHDAAVSFFRVGTEPGKYRVTDPLQLSVKVGGYKFVYDMDAGQEEQVQVFFAQHAQRFVKISFVCVTKQELDGTDYVTAKKGLVFGQILGIKVEETDVRVMTRDTLMRKRNLVQAVTGQSNQSGKLAD